MEQASIGKNKIFFWAIIIAVLNPVFSGILLGSFLFSEPSLRREGGIVLLFSLVWGVIAILLIGKFKPEFFSL